MSLSHGRDGGVARTAVVAACGVAGTLIREALGS